MSVQGIEMLSTVARELHISEEELLRQGLRRVLEHQLRAVKAEILKLAVVMEYLASPRWKPAIAMARWKRQIHGATSSAWIIWNIRASGSYSSLRL